MTLDEAEDLAVSASPHSEVVATRVVCRDGVLGHKNYYAVTTRTMARLLSHQECIEAGLVMAEDTEVTA